MRRIYRILSLILALLLLSACSTPGAGETTADTSPTGTTAAPQKTDAEILAERRDIAEAEMRRMMTVLWRSEEDITYSKKASSMGVATDMVAAPSEIRTIVAGRLYSGMPYTHGCASGYSFLSFANAQDGNGIYTIPSIPAEMLTGSSSDSGSNRARISNDCASAVFWAWAKVSSSVFFDLTKRMVESMGCLKVGQYDAPTDTLDDTKEICKANGTETMYAAYAQMQKADAVVHYNSAGHAMMIVDVNVVYKGDAIDGDYSYVTVLEQVSNHIGAERNYYDENLKEKVYVCGGVDIRYSFKKLFDTGYLPVTCKELIDPSPLAEETMSDSEKAPGKDTLFKGIFQSNYRISSVTISITDASGKVVQELTGFGYKQEMTRIRLPRILDDMNSGVTNGTIDLSALPAGTYRCTYTCQISTGTVFTVRDFEFTV